VSDDTVHARLLRHLTAAGVPFRHVEHAATFTSEDSARERGEPLECGAKALVVKADDRFHLLVIPAPRKLSSKLARVALGAKQLRFATADELLALTGLVPGAVPPFGEPVLPLPLTADHEVGSGDDFGERVDHRAAIHLLEATVHRVDFFLTEPLVCKADDVGAGALDDTIM
jgi:Ala-tRNA(Pro) deacylase